MKKRESGLELVKIWAIFIIIISHVAQTMINSPVYQENLSEYLLITKGATDSFIKFILICFTYFGYFGVDIFVESSSWYLCEKDEVSIKKISQMIINVLFVSLMFLFVYICNRERIALELVLKSILPIFFFNNWFVSCYLLLYILHPVFNIILRNISRKQHSILCAGLIILYVFCNLFFTNKFYSNEFVDCILIYFCVAYVKKYLYHKLSTLNVFVTFLVAFLLLWASIGLTNWLGLYFEMLDTWVFKWKTMHNPFTLLSSGTLVLFSHRLKFRNQFINYISSLSIYIYIIHENIIFRNYTRVEIVANLLRELGNNNAIYICIICSLMLFIMGGVLGSCYIKLTNRLVDRLACIFASKIQYIIDKIGDGWQ